MHLDLDTMKVKMDKKTHSQFKEKMTEHMVQLIQPQELKMFSLILLMHTVSSISELRTGLTDGTEYTLTSEAVLVYQQSYRNQKVIQDG